MRVCARYCGATLLALLPAWVGALSLGAPQLDSGLGQVLELAIPIRTDADEDVDSKCVRLVNPADDQIPTLTVARIRVERDGMLLLARIQSLGPVSEPALRLVVEVGCSRRVQREYVLLIDPPALGRGAQMAERTTVPAPIESERAALAIGEPRIQAVQGRRLLLTAPLLGVDAARLTPACVRVVDDGGQPPVFDDARLRLNGAGSARPVVEISSTGVLRDRMLRIVVEAGCGPTVRREFNVLIEAAPVPTGPSPDASTAATTAVARAAAPASQAGGARAALPEAKARSAPPVAVAPPVPAPPPAEKTPAGKGAPAAPASDRLVLAAPDDTKVAADSRPVPVPDASEELVKRLDQLSSEVKRLRGELDAANTRNAAMAEKLAKGSGWPLGWWIIGLIALAFAAWLAITWRRRGNEAEEAVPSEGPLTRIIGKPTIEVPAAQPSPVGTALGSVLVGSHLSEMRPELHVTEMADEDAIRELYADVIRGNTKPVPAARTTNVDIPLDLLLGDTAISGSVDNERDGRKDVLTPTDALTLSEAELTGDAQPAPGGNAAAVEPADQAPMPPSQLPTTVLKPLELDLDLSNFTRRNDKLPPN